MPDIVKSFTRPEFRSRDARRSRLAFDAVKWLALMAGGALGAMLRFTLTNWVDQRLQSSMPWGTMVVNVVGCLVIGFLATVADERGAISQNTRIFLITGLLGALTTFSSFGLESWRLIETGRLPLALANTLGSVALCLIAVAGGIAIARAL